MSQSGHSQLVPNVIASGFAFAVAVVIGFIMPRIIYESVGPVTLGLWDLGWSFLVYLAFSGIGLGQAIAHYVAGGTPDSEPDDRRQVCATGFWLQLGFAVVICLAFITGLQVVGHATEILETNSTASLSDIGLFLGIAMGVVIIGDVAHGVLLGAHKARITEAINIVHDVTLAIGMIWVLAVGFGIEGLAIVTALIRIAAESVRFWFAFRVCDAMTLSFHNFSFSMSRRLVRYGIKTSTFVFQELLVYQVARLLLFLHVGPLALAAFSRYATLARQINRMVDRLSISVPSLTSGLLAEGDDARVRSLYINALQASTMVTLPALAVFCVFGDEIIQLWMGSEFIIPNIAWVLAGGCLMHASYAICHRTLSGVNAHGRIALFCLFSSGLILLGVLSLTTPTTPYSAAWLIMGTMIVTVHTPYLVYANRKLSVSFTFLASHAYGKPFLANALFLAALFWSSTLLRSGRAIAAAVVFGASVVALLFGYWQFVIGREGKQMIRQMRLAQLSASGVVS